MKNTVVLSLLLSMMSGQAFSAEEITFVADPWPPFAVSESSNQGISIDVAKKSLETQGYNISVKFIPWTRAIEGVKKGEYDITHEWISEEGEKTLLFSSSYAVNDVKFIKRKDDTFEYNGIESLKGKTVATIRGYAYGDDFLKNNDFKKEEASDFNTNIKNLLQRGWILLWMTKLS
ncbi:MAG: extracellular solute-binding protein [Alphaproteobacteria bacterium ADurb.Bin438]|nr:MAG: extracellular solute-binding protein [Alphaproteobacteria bacterium ADurb.Bin438]